MSNYGTTIAECFAYATANTITSALAGALLVGGIGALVGGCLVNRQAAMGFGRLGAEVGLPLALFYDAYSRSDMYAAGSMMLCMLATSRWRGVNKVDKDGKEVIDKKTQEPTRCVVRIMDNIALGSVLGAALAYAATQGMAAYRGV